MDISFVFLTKNNNQASKPAKEQIQIKASKKEKAPKNNTPTKNNKKNQAKNDNHPTISIINLNLFSMFTNFFYRTVPCRYNRN